MTDLVLQLEKAQGLLRKISINVLNKNADFTLFTLPIEGIPLTEEQLDAFMGQYTFRSWYEQKTDGSWHPMPWWSTRENGDFELEVKLACKTATLVIEGKDYLFEEYNADEEGEEDDDDGEEMRPAARISSVKLKPTAGGTTLLSFHMQVRPRIGKASNALLEHMYRHIAVTLGEATVAAKRDKQQSLPLPDQAGPARPPEASAEVTGADAHPDPDATNGGESDPTADLAAFEEGARTRAEEFKRRASGTIDGTTMRTRRRRPNDDATH